MNKFVGLLIVIGLVVVVITNRDKIAALRGGAQTEESEAGNTENIPSTQSEPPPTATGAATPHPAMEAQAQAAKLYPGLLNPASPLNKRFIALHSEAKLNNPQLLTQADWPLTLAERAMVDIGGAPMARSTPAPITPKPLPGSALDQRPKK